MAKRRGEWKLIRARRWPRGLSDEKLAEFVATHDLSELIGGGRAAKVEFTHQAFGTDQEQAGGTPKRLG